MALVSVVGKVEQGGNPAGVGDAVGQLPLDTDFLEGTGEVRIGKDTYPIKADDVIACPPGDEDHAHQIINTGDVDLKFLAVSIKESPEIANYPDSGKFAVLADYPPNAKGEASRFMYVGRAEDNHDYWEDE